MRAPSLRALGFVSAWGPGAQALPADARQAAAGRPVLSLERPERAGDRYRRATRECLLGLTAVERMLEDASATRADIAGERTALIYVTAAAYGPSNLAFIERGGSGIHFAYTAPAVVPAEVAIEFGVTGPYTILLGGAPATLRAIAHAASLLQDGACDRALVLALEVFEECAALYARGRRLLGAPLVEAAGCLWLEPGQGELVLDRARGGRVRMDPTRRRLGESLSCEPLAGLALARERATGRLELRGAWRGERLRLTWTEARPTSPARVA